MGRSGDQRGQVLILFAILLVVLLAVAGLTIDIGRQVAERRHVQTAADAGALAACRALAAGATHDAATLEARTVARINLENSPSAGAAVLAPDGALVYEDGHAGDPSYLASGVFISGTDVRVAITSSIDTALARVVGVPTLDTNARSRCKLKGGPGFADRCAALRGSARAIGRIHGLPGHGDQQHARAGGPLQRARVRHADPGQRDAPGPAFELYGPGAKAANDSSFRGFVALDVRNFQSTTSRIYYNGVLPGVTANTLKDKEGDYILTGYPGPMFPSVTQPADPNDQVATLNGNDTSMVVGNASTTSTQVGDRILLAVYSGTVMQIPDFAISPPARRSSRHGRDAHRGPNFTVSRNDAFNSTVTLHLHGDLDAATSRPPRAGPHPGSSGHAPGVGHGPADLVDRRLHPRQERDAGDHAVDQHPVHSEGDLHRLAGGALRGPLLPDAARAGAGEHRHSEA